MVLKMAFQVEKSAEEDEDIIMLTKNFEALKAYEGAGVGPSAPSEPTPDGVVCSNANVFGNSNPSNENQSSGNDLVGHSNNSWSNRKGKSGFGHGILDTIQKLTPGEPKMSFDVSHLINREMLKYNPTERNAIYEEVHGVGNFCPEESPAMVERALGDLENELRAIPDTQKAAYEQSQSLGKTYVNERDFRLRFLRAELFDAKNAAYRLIQFLDNVLEYYGPYALERPIKVTDFTKKEMKTFNIGRLQLLPYRDRGGRRVIVGIPNQDHSRHASRTRIKIHHYLWWVATETVESQRKGVVVITIHNPLITDSTTATTSDKDEADDFKVDREGHEVPGLPSMKFADAYMNRKRGMPARLVALHLCTPDTPFWAIVRSFTIAFLGTERCRLKSHVGQDIENRYQLSGYGIPLDQLPITESGKIKTTHFKKWIQLRKSLEGPDGQRDRELLSIVECPGLNDVVFRPSQSTMCHPGNVMFRGLVESKHFEHSIAPTREAKIEITKGVIQEVRDRGGRFLVWNNHTWWTELTDEKQIYAKIAVFFRNSKVSAKAKNNRQTTKSSTYIFAGDTIGMDDKRRKIDCDCTDNNIKEEMQYVVI